MSSMTISNSSIGTDSHFDALLKIVQLWYYQYEVTFSLYVLEPTERFIMNTIILSFLALFIYGIVLFTPVFVSQFLSRAISTLFWVYINDSGNQLVVQHNIPVTWVNATKVGWEKFGGYNI
ncbi:hypothetical protein BKA65DRAFT_560034 [Rhexocercosporidium sp. MPI-PUGE-AT-0058]|nr:hypothetical protein BKA65DRAFT_560034 [Rhexocercosporidium sp. MPI-PUGE-AT-0058]